MPTQLETLREIARYCETEISVSACRIGNLTDRGESLEEKRAVRSRWKRWLKALEAEIKHGEFTGAK